MNEKYLLKIRLFLTLMEHENQIAYRETQLGGWLSDHTAIVHEIYNDVMSLLEEWEEEEDIRKQLEMFNDSEEEE
jgi:hypothetical protein